MFCACTIAKNLESIRAHNHKLSLRISIYLANQKESAHITCEMQVNMTAKGKRTVILEPPSRRPVLAPAKLAHFALRSNPLSIPFIGKGLM
jgi:hypothetical protein